MITLEQALKSTEFHQEAAPVGWAGPFDRPCEGRNGPVKWRRSGMTKTWKTRPGQFKIPVKHGLRNSDYITQDNADLVHAAEDCPAAKAVVATGCPEVHEVVVQKGFVSRCICGHGKRSACHGWS